MYYVFARYERSTPAPSFGLIKEADPGRAYRRMDTHPTAIFEVMLETSDWFGAEELLRNCRRSAAR